MSDAEIILVVAAHPDDEVLGCGGMIKKYSSSGVDVHVLIMSEGITSRDKERDRLKNLKQLEELNHAAKKANEILGVKTLELLDFPDNRMDSVDLLNVVKSIEVHINKIKPSIVFSHSAFDLNIDHRIINEAVVTACRPQPGATVKELYFFEVPSSTEWNLTLGENNFSPNCYIDITHHLETKLDALQCYSNEMRPWPHARSIDAVEYLAKWRGSNIGVGAAESFMVGRVIR